MTIAIVPTERIDLTMIATAAKLQRATIIDGITVQAPTTGSKASIVAVT
eukprot:CAMPEP_0180804914 /NCGR_PEP_ID=MMETSP1038_2-20121128/61721_1 /TAXON_ID=632150 /ORGANISM="Azadinium spinosum, Strain 3D9" /LENGTH=48 /DNA_ID= /DNA_START= /DNA_END= /DNA_ORIENTATION=